MIRNLFPALGLLALAAQPVNAQTTQTWSSYVLGLQPAAAVIGTEKIPLMQSNTPRTATPQQILGAIAGDCTFTSSIICTKTNGQGFAQSATTDTTNASNINQGVLASARMSPVALANNGANGGVVGQLGLGNGGCGGTSQSTCLKNAMPTPTRNGDIVYWNSVAGQWQTLPGNNSGTVVLTENASGIPAWVAQGSGTVTNVAINSSALVSATGTCSSTGAINCTIGVAIASKSDEQNASSNLVATTPSQQQSHPSAAKAWAQFVGSTTNGNQTINSNYNISSISRTSAGNYTITFTTPFTVNFACVGSTNSAGSVNALSQFGSIVSGSNINLNFINIAGPAAYDPTLGASVVCFGTQ